MKKHAYLIIAHNNYYILEKLIKMLDNRQNDIYIHIDKKIKDFDFDYFKNITSKSNVTFTKRVKVSWGGYSQIRTEMILLEEACKNNYEYYHLISGVDLPIKTQEQIHKFFEENKGKEFIGIEKVNEQEDVGRLIAQRIKVYHFFNDMVNIRQNKFHVKLIIRLHRLIVRMQLLMGRDRYKGNIYYGPQWFSITDRCAKYILENRYKIKKQYSFTHCADEVFMQNIISNNKELYANIYNYNDMYSSCSRHIDWKRGNPYTFRKNDFEELINSDRLFARKFDYNMDKEIVDKIYNYIINGNDKF